MQLFQGERVFYVRHMPTRLNTIADLSPYQPLVMKVMTTKHTGEAETHLTWNPGFRETVIDINCPPVQDVADLREANDILGEAWRRVGNYLSGAMYIQSRNGQSSLTA